MAEKSKRVVIADVARAAGVSLMAVSSVLNNRTSTVRVSAETAERIRRVAAELQYRPSAIARSLRSQQTKTVGVAWNGMDRLKHAGPYYNLLLSGLMDALFEAGYSLTLTPSMFDEDGVLELADGRCDGVVWARSDYDQRTVSYLQKSPMPVVMLHAPSHTVPGLPTFVLDNAAGMKLALDHLAELGHTDTAYVTDRFGFARAEGKQRFSHYEEEATRHGLTTLLWVVDDEFHRMEDLLDQHPEVTGVVCFSELLAWQFAEACRSVGKRVPEDLSVVGFDSTAFCEGVRPTITAIHQPIEEMARDAGNFLIDLIEGRLDPASPGFQGRVYRCKLDVRESTGPRKQ